MPNTSHCDAHLMGDSAEDVDVDQRILRIVGLFSVVRKGLEEGLCHPHVSAFPPALLLLSEEGIVNFVVLHHDCRFSSTTKLCKLGLYVLGTVLDLSVDEADISLAEDVLLQLNLQESLRPPRLGNDDRPIRLEVQALDKSPIFDLPGLWVDFVIIFSDPLGATGQSVPHLQAAFLVFPDLLHCFLLRFAWEELFPQLWSPAVR
mmetsp:Transcript_65705/g.153756  ORF Transcript_65705/g.153756 Transcript_65705/m.153756 type:complete len:204 (+) Transcript_65705:1777-2388(+)